MGEQLIQLNDRVSNPDYTAEGYKKFSGDLGKELSRIPDFKMQACLNLSGEDILTRGQLLRHVISGANSSGMDEKSWRALRDHFFPLDLRGEPKVQLSQLLFYDLLYQVLFFLFL